MPSAGADLTEFGITRKDWGSVADQGPSSHPVDADPLPFVSRELVATVCWLTDTPLSTGARYQLRHTTRDALAVVEEVQSRLEIETLSPGRPPSWR
jgi:hypothetical protein